LSVLRWDPDRFRREVRVREEGVRKRLSRVIALASIPALLAGPCLALYLLMLGWKPGFEAESRG
jgi:hypothetical protein